jgi:hypothetical protein
VNRIQKPGVYLQNLQKGLDCRLIYKTPWASLQISWDFLEYQNYFPIEKSVEMVHRPVDQQVHGAV